MRKFEQGCKTGVVGTHIGSESEFEQSAGLSDPHAALPLDRLCQIYWQPLYQYIRRQGYLPHDAQDLTQGFFERLLRTGALANVQQEKGRLRSFILTAVRNYLCDEHDRSRAKKRGGDHTRCSFEQAANSHVQGDRAGKHQAYAFFDHEWALGIVQQAGSALASEYAHSGRQLWIEQLSPLLTREPEEGEYATLALKLRIPERAVGVAVHRLRKRYREYIRREVARTIRAGSDLKEEVSYLFRALTSRGV